MDNNKKIDILIISKYFMPRNTAGVYRVIGFLKYFGENNVRCSVLISSQQDTEAEGRLNHTIPDTISIYKAREWYIPKLNLSHYRFKFFARLINKLSTVIEWKLLPVDQFILWVPSAVVQAKKILTKGSFDVVLVTTPPRSIQLVGVVLKIMGVTKYFVADFRDSWTHQCWAPPVSWLNRKAEKLVLRYADMVVANTPTNKLLLEKDYPFVKGKTIVVPNGYFPEDAADRRAAHKNNKVFRLIYTGELYEGMFEGIAYSIKALKDKHPNLSEYFVAEFAGLMYDEDHEMARQLGINDVLKYHGFVSYDKSIELVRNASMVLFCLKNTPEVSNWVPSKLYFYLGQKRPVLALVPDGDAANIIKDVNAGYVLAPDAVDEIAILLERLIFSEDQLELKYNDEEWTRYSRREQVKYLSEKIKNLVEND